MKTSQGGLVKAMPPKTIVCVMRSDTAWTATRMGTAAAISGKHILISAAIFGGGAWPATAALQAHALRAIALAKTAKPMLRVTESPNTMANDLDKMLASTSPEQLAGDPIMRAAFIVGLMASDLFIPVMESEAEQTVSGGVSLMAMAVDDVPHVLIFSSEPSLRAFASTGQRFAKVSGLNLFPNLSGQNAILNPGPKGLKLTSEDIAQINGKSSTGQAAIPHGAPGHVHGPGCQH